MIDRANKYLIFSIIFILFLAIGSISASEDFSDDFALDNSDVNVVSDVDSSGLDDEANNILSSEENNDVLNINNDENTLNAVSNEELLSDSDDYYAEGTDTYEDEYVESTIYYRSITKKYTAGKIVYKVNAYDVYKRDGKKVKEPMTGSTIKLRVYTGSSYKNYYGDVNYKSLASIKISKLSVGKHKVKIYVDDEYWAVSSIKILKGTTKVSAPKKTAKYKQNSYFKIKVKDSYGKLVKYLKLKLKVFTGKKYKTYTVKTNYKGIAKFKTSKLNAGTHKVKISSGNKNYKVNKLSYIVIKKPKKRTRSSSSSSSSSSSGSSSGGYYIGSVNSDVFHYPSCASAKRIKSSNRITFSSRANAINAGYRPCQRCYP